MFQKICVGYDGSEPSENAVRIACALSATHGSEVHIVHTPHPETVVFALGAVTGYHIATTTPSPEDVKRSAEVMLDKAIATAAEADQANVITHVGQGDSARALTDYANDVEADLIVTGRRGLGNLTALVLGSTSQSVAHLAKCAHLTVM